MAGIQPAWLGLAKQGGSIGLLLGFSGPCQRHHLVSSGVQQRQSVLQLITVHRLALKNASSFNTISAAVMKRVLRVF